VIGAKRVADAPPSRFDTLFAGSLLAWDARRGGLAGLLAACREQAAEALLEHIDSSVRGMQTGPPRDDVAMLAVRVEGTSADLSDIFSPPEGASAL
jgi:hypothetical protein